jgi:UDP-N-acetylmuramyl pentapeptide phosphotransferase/UDP-N-acetylglucosamine-1-phosphate transferase
MGQSANNRAALPALLQAVARPGGTVGWVDDYRKVVRRNPKGLSPRVKFFWQSMIGLAAAAYLAYIGQNTPALNELIVPSRRSCPSGSRGN